MNQKDEAVARREKEDAIAQAPEQHDDRDASAARPQQLHDLGKKGDQKLKTGQAELSAGGNEKRAIDNIAAVLGCPN